MSNVENLENSKAKTPAQMVKEARSKLDNRRNSEFAKKIEGLVEKQVAAEKAVALVNAEIAEAIAAYEAGL